MGKIVAFFTKNFGALQPNPQKTPLWGQNLNSETMANTLRVIEDFFVMEVGDTFQWDENTKMYVAERSEEFHKSDDSDSELRSTYSSNFAISADYAKELIADGVLEEVNPTKKVFMNVFDEISRLQSKYTDELKNIDEDMASMPECLKVERITVLNNMLSLLEHLSGLKK